MNVCICDSWVPDALKSSESKQTTFHLCLNKDKRADDVVPGGNEWGLRPQTLHKHLLGMEIAQKPANVAVLVGQISWQYLQGPKSLAKTVEVSKSTGKLSRAVDSARIS